MDRDTLQVLFVGLVIGLFFLGIVVFIFWTESIGCQSRWQDFKPQWGPIKGCLIEVNGKTIPASAYYIKEDLKK